MTGYKMPVFQTGSLLTQEMLDAMKQYMMDIASGIYATYSNGIINGMQISVSDGRITVGGGLIKYQNMILVMPENASIPFEVKNEVQILKLCMDDKQDNEDFKKVDMWLTLNEEPAKGECEIELCRMRIQNGAVLRYQYRSLEDMGTEYDTVQLIHTEYAAYREKGIHPQILEQFAKEAAECRNLEAEDICFLQQIYSMQGTTCNRQLVEFYLFSKLKGKISGYSNAEIYQGLCTVLRQLKTGVSQRNRVREMRRIIVD